MAEARGEWVLKNKDRKECRVIRVRSSHVEELCLTEEDPGGEKYMVNDHEYRLASPSTKEPGHWHVWHRDFGELQIDDAYPPKDGWVKCRLKSLRGRFQ